ncbi:MAG: ParB/RepB/Spo0J family partition protein [Spirochaetia bacterium]|nr:ParB/RepB/Spo0J family partition protein [Spirochaetota bacterium]MCX8096995.1 ParB/RepB/Spo0J family partition protein [Spirochaetota bacterium]MDW8111922.1 ParB/RepB/Spo0J family partition protein [Spirochaetia bacterium]
MKERGLGKGIKALLEDFDLEDRSKITNVSIDKIKPNPNQPRKNFNENSLKELAESIKEKGILQPIIVRERNGYYEIVAGERRWRSAKIAGLSEVPVIIRNDIDDTNSLELALIENIQREDLNPIDLASAYNELIEKYNLTQEDISKVVGKSRSAVANTLRLLKLPDKVKEYIIQGTLSEGHGRTLLSLESDEEILKVAKECIDKNLSVRELEELINFRKNSGITLNVSRETKQNKNISKSMEISNIEEDFIERLGTKVSVIGDLNKGKIVINYYSRDDLEKIYSILMNKK